MADLQPGPDESLDRFVGDWRIFQLRKGHRFSTDDLVTAWRASQALPGPTRLLDIGCGIGSVGLATLWAIGRPDASLVGIEAQEISVGLARRTAARAGLSARVDVRLGDLRDASLIEPERTFELITGSPPYIPIGNGVISTNPQRAACRHELRGSVYDYCEAARRWLAPGGRFCFVMAAADPRTEDAPRQAGLAVVERWDYVFRAGGPPHIATLVCAREEDAPASERLTGRLVIRGVDGEWTEEYLTFRQAMGNRPEA